MKTGVYIALGLIGVVIAGIIGYSVYESSKNVANAGAAAGQQAGTALGASLIQNAGQTIGQLLGVKTS